MDRELHSDAQPYGRGDRLQAALAGSPSASPPGGPSPTTLGGSMASSTSSRFEKFAGGLVVLLLVAYALYCGMTAILTGELNGTGSQRNNWHHTGLQAQLEGVFLVAVGLTISLLPFVDFVKSRLLRVVLILDALLFLVAAFAYTVL